MTKISTFSLALMHTEECFGFFKLVKEETALLTGEAVKPAIEAFTTAYDAFDGALKDTASTPGGMLATQCDARRDFAYRGLAAFVKVVAQYHPNPDFRNRAQEAKDILDKYGDPTSLPQTKESGILHNLLQDLAGLDGEESEAAGMKPFIDELDAAEEAFLKAVKQRTEEDAQRVTGIVKQTRTATETAYRQLIDVVNALSVLNPSDESYTTFADHLNALIDRQKTVLKARNTAKAKKMKN